MHNPFVFIGFGLFAGIVNAVAGGGAIIIYPLLISFGIPPINANATTTIIVWPGAFSSAYGYRKYIRKIPKRYFLILIPSIAGGLIGAIILKDTPNDVFKYIVPWFIFSATLLVIFQPRIHKLIYKKKGNYVPKHRRNIILFITCILTFLLAIYGGYFGAGFGIIMLGLLGVTEITNIHQMNGLKNLSAVSINVFASIYFVANRLVDWRYTPLFLLGSIVGGFLGSTYSDMLPKKAIRGLIILIGIVVTIALLIKI